MNLLSKSFFFCLFVCIHSIINQCYYRIGLNLCCIYSHVYFVFGLISRYIIHQKKSRLSKIECKYTVWKKANIVKNAVDGNPNTKGTKCIYNFVVWSRNLLSQVFVSSIHIIIQIQSALRTGSQSTELCRLCLSWYCDFHRNSRTVNYNFYYQKKLRFFLFD